MWFYNFLTNRSHFVRLPGGISADSPVLSGVPQGTVLRPLLFLIMIVDFNKDISESTLISFADDTRIYTKLRDVSDCNLLQQDLNHMYDWATTNNMFFNAQKFHYITFSSKECCCLPTPMTLAIGGVRCSRMWSTSQLLRPSGQQCSHSGGVCPQIQG